MPSGAKKRALDNLLLDVIADAAGTRTFGTVAQRASLMRWAGSNRPRLRRHPAPSSRPHERHRPRLPHPSDTTQSALRRRYPRPPRHTPLPRHHLGPRPRHPTSPSRSERCRRDPRWHDHHADPRPSGGQQLADAETHEILPATTRSSTPRRRRPPRPKYRGLSSKGTTPHHDRSRRFSSSDERHLNRPERQKRTLMPN